MINMATCTIKPMFTLTCTETKITRPERTFPPLAAPRKLCRFNGLPWSRPVMGDHQDRTRRATEPKPAIISNEQTAASALAAHLTSAINKVSGCEISRKLNGNLPASVSRPTPIYIV